MSQWVEQLAAIPCVRTLGSAVTSKLKRWSSDVAVTGFPRCGNTWYSALMRHLLAERYGLPPNAMKRAFVSDRGLLPLDFLERTHAMPRIYHTSFMTDLRQAGFAGTRERMAPFASKPTIVLIRDCKDALASYYLLCLYNFRPVFSFSRSIDEFVRSPIFGVEKFVSYYNLLAEVRRVSGAPTLITRYEELWRDPVATLGRDAHFAGFDGITRAMLERVVERCNIETMRKIEAVSTEETVILPGLSRPSVERPEAYRVRKGGSGNWRDQMTPELASFIDGYVADRLDPYFRP
jgi:Sulfotransferase domain